MNPKQKLFCETYLANGMNATQAYLSVYKCKTEEVARKNSSRLLTNADVTIYLKEKGKIQSENLGITVQTQLEKLNCIYKLAMQFDVTGKRQLTAASKAIEIQNQMLGLNAPTKTEVSGQVSNPELTAFLAYLTTKKLK